MRIIWSMCTPPLVQWLLEWSSDEVIEVKLPVKIHQCVWSLFKKLLLPAIWIPSQKSWYTVDATEIWSTTWDAFPSGFFFSMSWYWQKLMPLTALKNFVFKRHGKTSGWLSSSREEPTATKQNNPISQLTYKHCLTIAIWSYQQSINKWWSCHLYCSGIIIRLYPLGRRYYQKLPWIQIACEGFRMTLQNCTRLNILRFCLPWQHVTVVKWLLEVVSSKIWSDLALAQNSSNLQELHFFRRLSQGKKRKKTLYYLHLLLMDHILYQSWWACNILQKLSINNKLVRLPVPKLMQKKTW